jgi:altronate hydrolase
MSLEVNSRPWPRAIIGGRVSGLRGGIEEDEMTTLIRLSDTDNVAVAAKPIAQGVVLELEGRELRALDPIPFAHKIAVRLIEQDAQVIKYGVPIGRAKVAIEAGRHVHVHNIRSDYVNNEVDFFEDATAEGERA